MIYSIQNLQIFIVKIHIGKIRTGFKCTNRLLQCTPSSDLYNAQTPFMFEAMSPNAFNYDNQGSAGDIARGEHTATH